MCVSLSLMCLTYKEPILALKLDEYKIGVMAAGAIFSLDTITYTTTSALLNCCVKEEENGPKYGRLQFFGAVIFFFCMLFQGPAPFLPDKLGVLMFGVALGGAGGALINNNSPPAMIHTETSEAKKTFGIISLAQQDQLQSSVAAIHTGAFGLGAIIGPLLGSAFTSLVGYGEGFMITAVIVLALSVLHFIS